MTAMLVFINNTPVDVDVYIGATIGINVDIGIDVEVDVVAGTMYS